MTQERKKVNRTRFSTSVDIKLLETLDDLSKETRIPKSKLIDMALETLFERYQIEKSNKKNI
ncbi:ribbon-helix-helix domain-containing protein [Paraclostridium sordellii]|uniref:ribbon-helix-helix domain-containing protein n=1 Tax=Paraclostridium sordellii TaxID=1505 RepID=UPI0005DC100E|nr:ribbon-helix-helix domain-containing protein [Paeniclostridium sordellii]CEP39688.1 Ribbon-helix-helix domain [[Clostridium] sordellii] [Paeniclostridium sordellii]